MKIVGTSSNGISQEMFSTQILIKVEVEVEVVKAHFEIDTKIRMVEIINMKVNFMEVDEQTLDEKEVVEMMVEIIKVNNQIVIQTTITIGNMATWQKIVIKSNMMHKMESCNKGTMHQLAIK
jgi:hypothetical protein